MSKKHDVIIKLFNICKNRNNFIFDNDLVKDVSKEFGFGNPFDVTKIDASAKLPDELKNEDYCIAHLGKGKHQFIKGIDNWYHQFEKIEKEPLPWKYRKSILNELNTSESNILSVGFNQHIVHDFLYDDAHVTPKLYNSHRTKCNLKYSINNQQIIADKLQIEIDMTLEYNGKVTVFEAKNGDNTDFAVYQLFHPFLYYLNLKNTEYVSITEITCCYLLRFKKDDETILQLYNYTFEDPNDIASIKLLNAKQYNLYGS